MKPFRWVLMLIHAWRLRRRYPERTTPASQMWTDYQARFEQRRHLEQERRLRALARRVEEERNGQGT